MAQTSDGRTDDRRSDDGHTSFLAGLPAGIGMVLIFDLVVLHQLLAWHHFYDRATPAIGLASDGFLHAFELLCLVGGLYLLAVLRGEGRLRPGKAVAGILIGAGGFAVFDGIVFHKVLRLHQLRYVDELWVYDLVWNGAGGVLLLIGCVMAWRLRGTAAA